MDCLDFLVLVICLSGRRWGKVVVVEGGGGGWLCVGEFQGGKL